MIETPFPRAGAAAPAVEQRSASRYRILQRCFARPQAAPGAEGWRGIACDISAAGIGVILPLPLRRGRGLLIEPWNLPGGKPVRLRVARASPLGFGWLGGAGVVSR